MAINFPTWVTDDSSIPAQYLVGAKKLLYTMAACEYSRRLLNAMTHWRRVADGETRPDEPDTLSQEEMDILAANAPYTGPGYDFGRSLSDAPSRTEVDAWTEADWQPRQDEVQATRAAARRRLENFDLSWVDWDGVI